MLRTPMLIAASILALTASAAAQAPADPGLPPLRLSAVAGAPTIVAVQQPASEVLALRLAVPVAAAFDDIAAARLLQRLAEPALRDRAAELGAALRLDISNGAAVYALSGAAADAAALLDLLHRAVGAPRIDPQRMSIAAHEVREAARAEAETPAAMLRRRLTVALFPLLPTFGGRAAAVSLIGPDELRRFHSAYYRPERMRLVVVGPVDIGQLRSSLSGWAAPARRAPTASAPPAPDAGAPAEEASPQVGRSWVGIGILADDERTGDLLVGAPFIEVALDSTGLDRTGVEVWWHRGEAALVALAASPAATDGAADAVAERIRGAVLDAVLAADEASVRRAADAMLHNVLYAARTPAGMADLIGSLFDRTGDPLAALSYLTAIRSATAASLAGTLLRLGEAPAVVVELKP